MRGNNFSLLYVIFTDDFVIESVLHNGKLTEK